MNLSVIYIINRALRRILLFLHHWYIDGFLLGIQWHLSLLERMDHFFALKITVRNWLQPLYRDYTVLGYLLGIPLRTLRILVALTVYAVYVIVSALVYIIWAAVPIIIMYKIWYEISTT